MIIVADSGSTCTDWIIIKKNQISKSFKTKGFNPYFTKSEEITRELVDKFPEAYSINEIESVHFYGAGCSSEEMNSIIRDGLAPFFKNSNIEVNHDLLAAARALFMEEEGIAVILGTGSNTCHYNGKDIVKNITSTGFILGDEGGGDYLGKLFIIDFLNNEMPENIRLKFINEFKLSTNRILSAIYKEPYPNRFLASFTKFILDNSNDNYIINIINKSFTDLFEKHICKYENYKNLKIRLTGSISFYFEKFIRKVANDFNASIDLIEKEPITRLAQYHINIKTK